MSRDAGFTLVEALVGLVIIAVASAGLLRATEAHVDRVAGLETRAEARWVAENRLAELQLADTWPAEVTMLGRTLTVATTRTRSSDPALTRVDVAVGIAKPPARILVLSGFVDSEAAR